MITLVRRVIPEHFFSFIIAGASNTAFGYATFAFLIYTGLHYTLATLFSGVLSILVSYKVHRHYVFSFNGSNRLLRFVMAFAIVYLVCIAIQAVLLESGYTVNNYVSGAIAMAACPFVSFPLNKYYVFR